LKKIAPEPSRIAAVVICFLCAVISRTAQGAIVFTDDFETGRVNLNAPETELNGQWITTPNLSGWTLGGTQDVAGTDAYSSPDGTYFQPHSGHIAAAFYSSGNTGTVPIERPFPLSQDTGSISRNITTANFLDGTYNIRFWVSNPIADVNARQNLFSVTWGGIALDLSSYDVRFKAPVTPLDGGNELFGGPREFVVDAGTDWFEVNINGLTASAGTTTLKFTGQNNNSATLVDDVSVEETPEPSTLVLLGAGAALTSLRRRRRAVL
jgi:hypothetical protein